MHHCRVRPEIQESAVRADFTPVVSSVFNSHHVLLGRRFLKPRNVSCSVRSSLTAQLDGRMKLRVRDWTRPQMY